MYILCLYLPFYFFFLSSKFKFTKILHWLAVPTFYIATTTARIFLVHNTEQAPLRSTNTKIYLERKPCKDKWPNVLFASFLTPRWCLQCCSQLCYKLLFRIPLYSWIWKQSTIFCSLWSSRVHAGFYRFKQCSKLEKKMKHWEKLRIEIRIQWTWKGSSEEDYSLSHLFMF